MVWQSYSAKLVVAFPQYCRVGQGTWMVRCPLILYAIVECHYLDRVLWQFGMRQVIPERCNNSYTLHKADQRGHGMTDWSQRHSDYLELWDHHL